MIQRFVLFLGSFLFACSIIAHAQTTIAVPPFHDKYSELVKRLESGQTDIDYKVFRTSFIESEQFKIASGQSTTFDSLKKAMYAAMHTSSYPDVLRITKAMLSIDYTSMLAHKILQQTSKIIGDSATRKQHHDIEFGLLNSIVKGGDGKTCETGWPVIQIAEEYFILDMIDAKLQSQSIDHTGGTCDKMVVTTDEGERTYYFEISAVVHGYTKLGIQ